MWRSFMSDSARYLAAYAVSDTVSSRRRMSSARVKSWRPVSSVRRPVASSSFAFKSFTLSSFASLASPTAFHFDSSAACENGVVEFCPT